MKLSTIKELIPSADTVVGRVIAVHDGVHRDLGEYVGDDTVMVTVAGKELLDSIAQSLLQQTIDTLAPNNKRVAKSTAKAVDLDSVEL